MMFWRDFAIDSTLRADTDPAFSTSDFDNPARLYFCNTGFDQVWHAGIVDCAVSFINFPHLACQRIVKP